MSTVAVFAHFDPGGSVAPHVDRYLAHLAATVDRVVVVSAADLTAEARRRLGHHGDLVVRDNVGYDFYSWKVGLDYVGDWDRHNCVIICNDSVIGPFCPMTQILRAMRRRADFWGITQSREIEPHIQSWFVAFERPVLQSGLLHGFWRAMTPESDRYWVIRRYEIGMSRLLRTAGFRMDSYFRPTTRDRIKSALRHRHHLRSRGQPSVSLARLLNDGNPMIFCWDAALDGRLPFVKVDVLRDEPYAAGAERMLRRLERAYPDALVGVREYLDRTRRDYRQLRAWTVAARTGQLLDAAEPASTHQRRRETIVFDATCRGQRARSSGTSRHRPIRAVRGGLVFSTGRSSVLNTGPGARSLRTDRPAGRPLAASAVRARVAAARHQADRHAAS